MVTSFNHSGFVVKDIEKMIAFYRDSLGLRVVREIDSTAPPEGDHTGISGAHRRLVFMGKTEGGHALELVYYISPPSPGGYLDRHQLGAAHICFDVEDLQRLYDDLSAKGVRFTTPPKYSTLPSGAKRGICYAQDPEGNWLEFLENTSEP